MADKEAKNIVVCASCNMEIAQERGKTFLDWLQAVLAVSRHCDCPVTGVIPNTRHDILTVHVRTSTSQPGLHLPADYTD